MKPLIVANWKMNPQTLTEARKLFNSVKKRIDGAKKSEVVICAPFVFLPVLKTKGAQDCFWEEKGAYTGEISPKMLKHLGIEYVIIGHSERRKHQRETDAIIKKKIEAALAAGLKVILCINKISQLPKNIKNWKLKPGNLIVAYEPLFAIGTGKPCSPEQAKRMRLTIKKKMNLPILYGGSVNSQNAKDYIDQSGFQGLLVGGASLKAKEFIKIIRNVTRS